MAYTARAKKILLVDDEEGLALLLSFMLQKDGYEVAVANDGEQAIEKLKTFEPDVIVSDVVMPNLDGIEMFKQIRANPKTANIPVIFISGFQDQQVLERARKIGVFGILHKPVDVEHIEARIAEMTRGR